MRVLDLFSGIGGFSLGLERAGMKTIAFCEIDKHAQRILRKNWIDIPIFDDIEKLSGDNLQELVGKIDLICGGFPCQDISVAGNKRGFIDENGNKTRSGLWFEYARIIREVKPKIVIVENVANILNLGLSRVLEDLNSIGYNARWDIISAASVGYPHFRKRMWIVAYANDQGLSGFLESYSYSIEGIFKKRQSERGFNPSRPFQLSSIPENIRMDDGLPNRSHRARQLGNAVVPIIPEIIGMAIMQALRGSEK
jgi:DNA (cytosine-5)-methyltransferase 1